MVEFGGLVSIEVVGAPCADLIDEVGEPLLQCFNRCILVVGPSRPFEESQQQNPGSPLFADAETDRAQYNAKRSLAFALALSVVDMQLAEAAFTAVGSCDDADAWLAVASGSARAIG